MSVRFSRQNISVLSTLLLVGVAFSVYFLFYIPIQEKKIIKNDFRVLNRIVQNIHSLEKNYIKNAEIISQNDKIKDVNKDINLLPERPSQLEGIDIDDDNNIYYTDENIVLVIGVKSLNNNSIISKYYSVSYSDFFNRSLFHRKDVFDQIIISKNGKPLYTNSIFSPLDTIDLEKSKSNTSIADVDYVSLNANINEDVFISGLISHDHFNSEKRSMPLLIIISSTVVLVFIVLSMPLLKLQIMGNFERLHRADVFFTGLSIVLGSAVLTILVLWSVTYFSVDKKIQYENLKGLSSDVSSNFQKELQEIVYELDCINTKYKSDGFLYSLKSKSDKKIEVFDLVTNASNRLSEFEEIPRYSGQFEVSGYRVFQNIFLGNNSFNYKNFNAVFWADDQGRGLVLLSPFENPSYAQDLKHRNYLTDIINNKTLEFTDTNGDSHEIAIESIKSVNDGRYETGIGYGTGTKTLPVIALSTKLGSVMESVLSEGYGFCILDSEGNTLFHSDINKNINENFLEETGLAFESAVLGKTEKIREVTYGGKKRLVFFKPLWFMPGYHLATFQDSVQFNSPYSLSIHTTVVLYFFFATALVLFTLLMYVLSLKPSKLRQQGFVFEWLRPKENTAYLKRYKILFTIFLVFTVLQILTGFMTRQQAEVMISGLVLNVAFLVFFSFSYLSGEDTQKEKKEILLLLFSAPFIILAILYLIYSRFCYLQLTIENLSTENDVLTSIAWVLNTSFFILTLSILFGFKITRAPVEALSEKILVVFDENVQKQYLYTTFYWVLITSVIPICLFFGLSLTAEQRISKSYSAYLTYSQLLAWEQSVLDEYKGKFKDENELKRLIESRRKDNRHIYLVGASLSEEDSSVFNPYKSLRYFELAYQLIRPFYNSYSRVSSAFLNTKGIVEKECDTCKEVEHFWSLDDSRKKIKFERVSSTLSGTEYVINLDQSNFRFTFYHFLGLMVLLLIYFQVYKFAVYKIFGFEYKKLALKVAKTTSKDFGEKLVKVLKNQNESSYNNVFLVGIDTSHVCHVKDELSEYFTDDFINLNFYDIERDFLSIQIDESEDSFEISNIKKFNDEFSKFTSKLETSEKKKIVVFIEHFEFAYNSKRLNRVKLHLLKYLVDRKRISVVISSEINATKLFDFYEDRIHDLEHTILKNSNANNLPRLKAELELLVEDSRKWQHVLGSFAKIILPMNKFSSNHIQLRTGDYHDYIMKLDPFKDSDLNDDDKILTVQEISYPFYFAVWNSLSKHERYIVYDIAKDNFINTSNVAGIQNLLNKGILVYEDSLRLMNDSFTNFVLSKVKSDEALEMEMESRKKGAWGSVSVILILLIVSLMVFLYFGQQSVIHDLSTVVTSLGAILGFLVRFGGIFSFSGNRSTSNS